jgi:hypothetical protein
LRAEKMQFYELQQSIRHLTQNAYETAQGA